MDEMNLNDLEIEPLSDEALEAVEVWPIWTFTSVLVEFPHKEVSSGRVELLLKMVYQFCLADTGISEYE